MLRSIDDLLLANPLAGAAARRQQRRATAATTTTTNNDFTRAVLEGIADDEIPSLLLLSRQAIGSGRVCTAGVAVESVRRQTTAERESAATDASLAQIVDGATGGGVRAVARRLPAAADAGATAGARAAHARGRLRPAGEPPQRAPR